MAQHDYPISIMGIHTQKVFSFWADMLVIRVSDDAAKDRLLEFLGRHHIHPEPLDAGLAEHKGCTLLCVLGDPAPEGHDSRITGVLKVLRAYAAEHPDDLGMSSVQTFINSRLNPQYGSPPRWREEASGRAR